jgi:hypothetical protein
MGQDIQSLGELRTHLKSKKKLAILAQRLAQDEEILNLLRREIESYFPKPYPLTEFTQLSAQELETLRSFGYLTTQSIVEGLSRVSSRETLAQESGISLSTIDLLYAMCSLTRIQWTSPLFARMLLDCGLSSPEKVNAADPETLFQSLKDANEEHHYFKGTIGLRDVKRLIHAAGYVQ